MAHRIDWDNIHLHIHDTDVRYKRRLLRKQLYIECSSTITNVSHAAGSLKKLKSVKDQNFMGNDELVVACPNVGSNIKPIRVEFGGGRNAADPGVEMFKEGFTEGGKSLVCKVEDNVFDDVSLRKLENVQDQKFLCNDADSDLEILCNDADSDLEMFEEGFTEGGKSLVCEVNDDASDDVGLKKLEIVQDQKFLCNDLYPEPEMFKEGLREGKKSLVCKVDDSASDDVCLKKLENVQDRKFLCNDLYPELEMFKEGLREGGKSLVCKVKGSASDDVSLKKLENIQDQKKLCNDVDPEFEMFKEGLREGKKAVVCEVDDSASDAVFLKKLENVQDQKFPCNDVKPDLELFEEGLRESGKSLVCKFDDNASDDVSLKKLKNVQERKFLCNDEFWVESSNVSNPEPIGVILDLQNDELRVNSRDSEVKFGAKRMTVDLDYKKFLEDLKVDGHSYALKVKKNDGSFLFLKYEKDVLHKDNRRKLTGYNVKNVPGKQKGDTANYLKNNTRKERRDKVVPRREGFSGNSNISPVTKRSSVVKRRENMEIISIGIPIEMEEVIVSKNNRPSKTIRNKRQRPLNLDDGRNLEHLRKSKKKYEKVERRPCLTRIDHVSNLMDIAGKSKRQYRRTSPRSERRDLMVQQVEDIEMSRFSSGIGNMDVMVKEEKFDDSTNAVIKKRSQMIQGRDSVNDNNMQPRYKCDKKFGKYVKIKEVNANSLNYDEEDNERRYLMVQQGEDIENSRFSSGIGNMDVMVKEEKFDDRTNVVVKKKRQMIRGRDSVNDFNMRPRYKCDKKFGKYAEVKEVNANSLYYDEEDNEHSSDLEILDMDNQQNLRKFEVMKVLNASVIEDYPLSRESPSDYENPEFREELMDILRRPFNLEEYRSLMQKAKYRHLMGGPEYSDGLKGKKVSNTYGKSPLDYHPDVQKRLCQCRKISRRLNILRGFIYWYERACQNGAFKPWLDKSCAAVTPSPR